MTGNAQEREFCKNFPHSGSLTRTPKWTRHFPMRQITLGPHSRFRDRECSRAKLAWFARKSFDLESSLTFSHVLSSLTVDTSLYVAPLHGPRCCVLIMLHASLRVQELFETNFRKTGWDIFALRYDSFSELELAQKVSWNIANVIGHSWVFGQVIALFSSRPGNFLFLSVPLFWYWIWHPSHGLRCEIVPSL